MYALPRGDLAGQGLVLRSGRAEGRPGCRRKGPGAWIVRMTSIDNPPADAAGCQVPALGRPDGDTSENCRSYRAHRSFRPVRLESEIRTAGNSRITSRRFGGRSPLHSGYVVCCPLTP